MDCPRRRSFSDYNVEGSRFHCGIENLLNEFVQPVYFVDKKNISRDKVRENRGEISHALDRGAGCDADIRIHLARNQVRQGRLPEPRGTREKDVLHRLRAHARGVDKDAKVSLHVPLSDVVRPLLWAEREVERIVLFFRFIRF